MTWNRLALLTVGLALCGCTASGPNRPIGGSASLDPRQLLISDVSVVDVVNKRILSHQYILVCGEKIQSVTPQPPAARPARTIDGSHLVALPGFVNTHTHLWQHVARSIAPASNLQEWARRVYGVADFFTPEELRDVTLAASAQAALSGITTVVDFASVNYSESALDTTVRAIDDAGLGGVVIWWSPAAFLPPELQLEEIRRLNTLAPGRLEVWVGPGPLSFFSLPAVHSGVRLAQAAGVRLAEHTMENIQEQRDFEQELQKYLNTYGSRMDPTLVDKLRRAIPATSLPSVDGVYDMRRRAAMLLSNDDAKRKDDVPDDKQRVLSEEDRATIRHMANMDGPSPLMVLDQLGALPGFLAIHSVWLNDQDMELCRKNHVSVSLNPESNMYLSSGVAPLAEYLRRGINVTIGTDGAASNDGIDFFSAMRASWNLQKAYTLDTEMTGTITSWDILRAATINGARAIGKDTITGSLDTGKEADIVLLSTDSLGMAPFQPQGNGPSLIINSAGVRDVRYVLSNGRVVVDNGRLARFEEATLSRRLSSAASSVFQRSLIGKTFSEHVTFRDHDPSLFRYRTIRKRDAVEISVANAGSRILIVQLACSGTPLKRTASPILRADALALTPLDRLEAYFEREVELASGESLMVLKETNSQAFRIRWQGHEEERASPVTEQIYLRVDRRRKAATSQDQE